MADKRRDSGEYYPGGRVIARRDVAPPQIVVQWSDVQGKPQIAPLPDRYRDSDVKGKINEIASKFATLVMAALIGWSAFGELVVQKAQKGQIWNDEVVVTNAYLTGENASGAARTLPKYLWLTDFDDSYPDAAAEYYRSRGDGKVDGGCSAVRSGGYLSRNFDFPFDERAEFVVKMAAGAGRFASVGVAQVGTNLTEQMVTSGKPSRWYKALPGATVDGINENGVVAEINVVDGDPQTSGWHTGETSDAIHPLGAIRHILDHATNAQSAAEYIAENIRFPAGWAQNFHYMIADAEQTWIVENGHAVYCEARTHELGFNPVMTNFKVVKSIGLSPRHWVYAPIYIGEGSGAERLEIMKTGSITNAWYTRAYRRETNPPWVSDLAEVIDYTNAIFDAWAAHDKEYFRGKTNGGIPWWQSVHTSVYDITNRTLRVAVQEVDDWYTFAVPSGGAVKSVNGKTGEVVLDAADVGAMPDTFEEQDPTATAKANAAIAAAGLDSVVKTNVYGEALVTTIKFQNSDYPVNSLEFRKNDGTVRATLYSSAGEVAVFKREEAEMAPGVFVWSAFGGNADMAGSIALGESVFVRGRYATALGNSTVAQGNYSTAIGYQAFANNSMSFVASDSYLESHGANTINFGFTDDPKRIYFKEKTLDSMIGDATNGLVSADNPAFSNAVLAVQVDTNLVASIGELGGYIKDYGEMEATSLGGLLLAILGAFAFLKKNALTDGLTDGEPTDEKLHKFFKESNTLLTGTIEAKIANLLANIDPDTASVYDLIKALKGE